MKKLALGIIAVILVTRLLLAGVDTVTQDVRDSAQQHYETIETNYEVN